MRTKEEIKHAFMPMKTGTVQQHKINVIQERFLDMAYEIENLVPESADRTAALRKLLEAKMTCVQAISHDKSQGAQASSQEPVPNEKVENGKKKSK